MDTLLELLVASLAATHGYRRCQQSNRNATLQSAPVTRLTRQTKRATVWHARGIELDFVGDFRRKGGDARDDSRFKKLQENGFALNCLFGIAVDRSRKCKGREQSSRARLIIRQKRANPIQVQLLLDRNFQIGHSNNHRGLTPPASTPRCDRARPAFRPASVVPRRIGASRALACLPT